MTIIEQLQEAPESGTKGQQEEKPKGNNEIEENEIQNPLNTSLVEIDVELVDRNIYKQNAEKETNKLMSMELVNEVEFLRNQRDIEMNCVFNESPILIPFLIQYNNYELNKRMLSDKAQELWTEYQKTQDRNVFQKYFMEFKQVFLNQLVSLEQKLKKGQDIIAYIQNQFAHIEVKINESENNLPDLEMEIINYTVDIYFEKKIEGMRQFNWQRISKHCKDTQADLNCLKLLLQKNQDLLECGSDNFKQNVKENNPDELTDRMKTTSDAFAKNIESIGAYIEELKMDNSNNLVLVEAALFALLGQKRAEFKDVQDLLQSSQPFYSFLEECLDQFRQIIQRFYSYINSILARTNLLVEKSSGTIQNFLKASDMLSGLFKFFPNKFQKITLKIQATILQLNSILLPHTIHEMRNQLIYDSVKSAMDTNKVRLGDFQEEILYYFPKEIAEKLRRDESGWDEVYSVYLEINEKFLIQNIKENQEFAYKDLKPKAFHEYLRSDLLIPEALIQYKYLLKNIEMLEFRQELCEKLYAWFRQVSEVEQEILRIQFSHTQIAEHLNQTQSIEIIHLNIQDLKKLQNDLNDIIDRINQNIKTIEEKYKNQKPIQFMRLIEWASAEKMSINYLEQKSRDVIDRIKKKNNLEQTQNLGGVEQLCKRVEDICKWQPKSAKDFNKEVSKEVKETIEMVHNQFSIEQGVSILQEAPKIEVDLLQELDHLDAQNELNIDRAQELYRKVVLSYEKYFIWKNILGCQRLLETRIFCSYIREQKVLGMAKSPFSQIRLILMRLFKFFAVNQSQKICTSYKDYTAQGLYIVDQIFLHQEQLANCKDKASLSSIHEECCSHCESMLTSRDCKLIKPQEILAAVREYIANATKDAEVNFEFLYIESYFKELSIFIELSDYHFCKFVADVRKIFRTNSFQIEPQGATKNNMLYNQQATPQLQFLLDFFKDVVSIKGVIPAKIENLNYFFNQQNQKEYNEKYEHYVYVMNLIMFWSDSTIVFFKSAHYSIGGIYDDISLLPEFGSPDLCDVLRIYSENLLKNQLHFNDQLLQISASQYKKKIDPRFINLICQSYIEEVYLELSTIQNFQVKLLQELIDLFQYNDKIQLTTFSLNFLDRKSWNELEKIYEFLNIDGFQAEQNYQYFLSRATAFVKEIPQKKLQERLQIQLLIKVEEYFLDKRRLFQSSLPYYEVYRKNQHINWESWLLSLDEENSLREIQDFENQKSKLEETKQFLETLDELHEKIQNPFVEVLHSKERETMNKLNKGFQAMFHVLKNYYDDLSIEFIKGQTDYLIELNKFIHESETQQVISNFYQNHDRSVKYWAILKHIYEKFKVAFGKEYQDQIEKKKKKKKRNKY